ncbi:glycosyltransferase [Enterococcus gallinarum]|uniref:glycosyltransferase n=1 Tax=Enterococcus gallinarum TaxID=1353 RepID=UPI00295428E9|nr:glycosyltransferase [Enterococcus gallinarum]MDV7785569.1 glycosyltransferase [Enterococcus gallinarum]
MKEELISVILTVYNGEKTIIETLQSLLNQSYKNFEIIVVDDYSTDSSVEIIKNFINEKRIDQIKLFYSPEKGRSKALNYAISKSKGMFLANIDADDLAHPYRLEKQFEFFRHNSKYGLVSSKSEIIFNNQLPKWQQVNVKENDFEIVNNKLRVTNPISHPGIMVNFNVIEKEHFFYNEKLDKVVDYELWLRLYEKGIKMAILNDKLIAKRIHNNQSFENKKRIQYLKAIKNVQLNTSKNLSLKESFLINLKFIYGLLPQKIRMIIRGRI